MKPSQILRETTIPQIKRRLIKFRNGGKVAGKCAMGVLACECGNPDLKLSPENETVHYEDIFEAFGIKEEDQYMPNLNSHIYKDDDRIILNYDDMWDFDKHYPLHFVVTALNDNYGLSFDEIADFLEVTFDL